MAITEPVSRIDDFTDYYGKAIVKMVGTDSAQIKAIDLIAKTFDELGISTEQKGAALSEMAVQMAIQFNKDATNAALELIRMEPEFELKAAQRDLTVRQIQGFDDSILMKMVEEQGGLASFAVNAGSDTAQTTINDLKLKMQAVETRVVPLGGGSNCPIPTPITPVPTNFNSGSIQQDMISIHWNAVIDATSYLVYKDGILVSTQGHLSFIDTGLTPNTKYAYAIKASINGVESNYSNTLVVTTEVAI